MEKIPVHSDPAALAAQIRLWGLELGFQQLGISGLDLQDHGRHLQRWLDRGFHGDMAWMATHGEKRWRPEPRRAFSPARPCRPVPMRW